MPRIGRYPPFGKRFFRLARKLIGSCHFQHFWRVVMALAAMQGRRSLNRMQGATLVFRGVVIPFRISLWAAKQFCQASRREPNPAGRIPFRKLTELAADAIDAVALPEGVKGIVLFDAYYLCPTVTRACRRNGFRYVGVARKIKEVLQP